MKRLRPRRPWSNLALPQSRARTPEFDLRTVQNLTAGHRAVLALVAAHPFLTTGQVGRFFGWTPFVRQFIVDDLLRWNMLRPLGSPGAAGGDVLEANSAGLEVVAAEQGHSLAFVGRWKALAGGGPVTPFGARRSLTRHLAHTQGVNEFFIGLAESAVRSGGELLEWQNPGECSHWPAHPDGYGVLRLNGRNAGFFLEFDRGTMSARDYFGKLSAYYDYRDSQRFERDYDGFPMILFVTTTDVAERRFAGAAQAAGLGRGVPLKVLLTAHWRITDETNSVGALAAIWRTPTDPLNLRRSWPPRCGESKRLERS